ncbi:DUF6804 family protein [Leifsonia poae]|uniref:DUF6804 family protein n=1 Tax=Leifsonia poae TaxID=110933 RepID=UPI003D693B01
MSRPHTPQQPAFNRAALAPGMLGALILLFGLALPGDWYLYVRYAVSILALILCVFAGQAGRWWWLAGLIPIAVLWNPVWPITAVAGALPLLSLAAAAVFIVAALTIKIPADTRR